MASSSMQTVLNKSPIQGGGSLASHSLPKKAQVFTPARLQQRRAAVHPVVASASKGPSDAFMQGMGALAAAQIMLFPMAANADILPKTATSESARAELNAKTDNLPSITDVGGAIKDALPGGGSDVQNKAQGLADKAGREANKAASKINNATPDLSSAELQREANKLGKKAGNAVSNGPSNLSNAAPDLNLKGAANKAKAQVDKLGKKINNATPDLSDAGSDAKAFANKVGNKVNKAANDLSNAAPDLGDAKSAANQAKSKANKVGNKINNATPDLSDALTDAGAGARKEASKIVSDDIKVNPLDDLPSNKASNAAGDAATKVQNAASDAKTAIKNALPDLGDAGSDAKAFANKVGNKVNKAANNLSNAAPDLGDAKSAANQAKSKANKVGNKINNATPDLSDALTDAGAGARKEASKIVSDDIKVNPFKDGQTAANKASNVAGDAATKVQNLGSDAKTAVKNALPDLSFLPSLKGAAKGAADKAGDAFNAAGQTTDKYTPDQTTPSTGINPFKFAARDAQKAKAQVGETSPTSFQNQARFGESNKAGQNNESLEKTTEKILEQTGEKSENIGAGPNNSVYGVEKP